MYIFIFRINLLVFEQYIHVHSLSLITAKQQKHDIEYSMNNYNLNKNYYSTLSNMRF